MESRHVGDQAVGSHAAALFFLGSARAEFVDYAGQGGHLAYFELVRVFRVDRHADFACKNVNFEFTYLFLDARRREPWASD